MKQKNKKVSIVICAYNEEENILKLKSELYKEILKIKNFNFQLILVDNGSTDKTISLFKRFKPVRNISEVKLLELSRNFGTDGGYSAGLSYVNGDACIFLAADLQDPPKLINEFLKLWLRGYENVYGKIKSRNGTSLLRKFNSNLFYFILKLVSKQPIPKNASDFRLLDKAAYESLRELPEKNKLLRGMVAWIGFRSYAYEYHRQERFSGRSKAGTLRMVSFALKGIVSFSNFPLKAMSILGFLNIIFICCFLFYGLLNNYVVFNLNYLLSIITIFTLSTYILIMSIYISLLFEEIKGRPSFLIKKVIDL